jgi:hypothetical protein
VWAAYGDGRAEIFIDGAPAIVTAAGHKILVLDEERPPVPVSRIATLFYFAAGAMAALLLGGRGLPISLAMGWPMAAAAPLLYALMLETAYGYDSDWALLGAAIFAPCLGAIVGWMLRRQYERPKALTNHLAAETDVPR